MESDREHYVVVLALVQALLVSHEILGLSETECALGGGDRSYQFPNSSKYSASVDCLLSQKTPCREPQVCYGGG